MVSPEFLADLKRVCSLSKREELSPTFVRDLEVVHAATGLTPDTDLAFLAQRFDAWRNYTRQFLGKHLSDLPADDPLCCPISLFGTMDYGRLETAHTRTLAWLLNPRKEHGFEKRLLGALLRRLVPPGHFDSFDVGRVESEHPVHSTAMDEAGRLDVLAEGRWARSGIQLAPWSLVIEAKIDAGEGEGQLAKYDDWLRAYAQKREVLRVLLTPDARGADSAAEAWQKMSWLDLVQIFRGVYDNLREAPGYHFLRYYLAGVLRDVCGWRLAVTESCADPYALRDYLKTARLSPLESAPHGHAR